MGSAPQFEDKFEDPPRFAVTELQLVVHAPFVTALRRTETTVRTPGVNGA